MRQPVFSARLTVSARSSGTGIGNPEPANDPMAGR